MSMRDPLGYYQILDLTPAASEAEIKANYRERAKLWHPDHNTSEEATDKFQHLSVAYDVLKDEKSRLIYDLLSQAYVSKNFPDMSGAYHRYSGVAVSRGGSVFVVKHEIYHFIGV